jgi:valyl-tRNA synthetase
VRQDEDVLDTWFSSALWPFATLGWPHDTPELRAFYPTDVLLTARDILFLWVARMIMMGIEFAGDIPFTDVYVHSIIQAPDGRRMSKSLGTGIDPIDLIEGGPRPPVFRGGGDFPAYGADAVRFGLLAMSATQDVRFSEEKVAQGSRLANKLWNASRLILLNVEPGVAADPRTQAVEDRWILSRLQRAKLSNAAHVEAFDFSHAALGLYDFVYAELCDWYLELAKPRLYANVTSREPSSGESSSGTAVSGTLLHVLGETLAMAHPVIPFVTEEIWSHLPGVDGLLAEHQASPPDEGLVDDVAEREVGAAIEAVQQVRGWRDQVGVAAADRVPARLDADGDDTMASQVARLARLDLSPDGGDPVARVAIPGGSVLVYAGGGFDPQAAERRRQERREHLQAEIDRVRRKLDNPGFVEKAPPAVVEAERQKLARLGAELDAL